MRRSVQRTLLSVIALLSLNIQGCHTVTYACTEGRDNRTTRSISAPDVQLLDAGSMAKKIYEVPGFENITAPQERRSWCGVAAIDAVLRSRGIVMTQEQIAHEVGTDHINGAVPFQIVRGLTTIATKRLGSHCVPWFGNLTTASDLTKSLISSLKRERPAIVGVRELRQNHVIVVYAAGVSEEPPGVSWLKFYDPDTHNGRTPRGEFRQLSGAQASSIVTFVIGTELIMP